jgi:hypothetical protein
MWPGRLSKVVNQDLKKKHHEDPVGNEIYIFLRNLRVL